jgi:hypothetical protein
MRPSKIENRKQSLCCPVHSRDYYTICGQIDEQGDTPEHDLRSTREPGGVEQRLDVVLNESSAVSRLPSAATERILERRQGTNPPGVLDENPPDGGGNVEQRHPGPAEHQQSAQYDKQDEREVNYEDEIGEGAVDQATGTRSFILSTSTHRTVELHPSHDRLEPWLAAQRIKDWIDAQIRRPSSPVIDGALHPIERSLLITERDVHDRHLHR